MSYVRLWNLSSQQFEDIAAMENGLAPGTVAIDWNEFAQTGETRIAGGGWYTFGFGLGSFEGLPVVGFTCPNAGKTWAEPGPAYRAMIVSGLVEGGLDEDIAEAYGKAWSATELYKQ